VRRVGYRIWAGLVLCACAWRCAGQDGEEEPPEAVEYMFFDETPVADLVGWRTAWGDSIEWADADYDDEAWEWDKGSGLWVSGGGPGKGVRWYRKHVFFPEALTSATSLALYQVAAVSASEIYWDGELIARNGEVAEEAEDEESGRSGQVFPIPASLTAAGKHVIALRVSNHHTFSGLVSPPLQIGYFAELQGRLFRSGALAFFLAGIFIVTALFHIAILFGHANKWTYALFSAFCVSCGAYIIIQSMLRYFQIDLAGYYSMAALNDIPWFFMMSLLPVFFMFEFPVSYRLPASVCIVAVTLIIVVLPRLAAFGVLPVEWLGALDRANRMYSISTIFISVLVSAWGIRKGMAGSLTVAIGLVIFLIGAYVSYRTRLEHGWAIGFAFLILVITISLSRQMAQRNRLHQETQLRSARLELELLKKHIQPHFLLNSLNSIVAWLEEEPRTAARLVNALADELRMLLESSGKKTVSLREEIRLCEAHLQVMSLRQEKQYDLAVEGVDGSEQFPPLIIHTLVENGLTHGYKGKDTGRFSLRAQHLRGALRLVLFNDSALDKAHSGYIEGTGLRYVRTRLEEAFAGKWSLAAGPVEGGWEVAIEIRKGGG